MTEFAVSGKARIAYDVTGYGETEYEPEHGGTPHEDALAVLDAAGAKRAAPALVLVGRLDAEEILAIAPQVAERIPGARLEHLDGVAHVPHLEADAATLSAITTFADRDAQR